MLFISRHGIVDAERVKVKIFPDIERTSMEAVNGIVVHQTGAATMESTFHSYRDKGANGAGVSGIPCSRRVENYTDDLMKRS